MSLDVYLTTNEPDVKVGSGIFVREDGQIKEISYSEWERRFPGREPVTTGEIAETNEVYWANITHNLNKMASKAGIYEHLWRPDELNITKAHQLIKPLEDGLKLLEERPDYFKRFNPPNGWGDYEGLVRFVKEYLDACRQYPDAEVNVSR